MLEVLLLGAATGLIAIVATARSKTSGSGAELEAQINALSAASKSLPSGRAAWENVIRAVESQERLAPGQLVAHAEIESGFQPWAIRHERRSDGTYRGASIGLVQVLWPQPAKTVLERLHLPVELPTLFDGEKNLRAGANLIRELQRAFPGNLEAQASAFNQGTGRAKEDLTAGRAWRNLGYVSKWKLAFVKYGGRL